MTETPQGHVHDYDEEFDCRTCGADLFSGSGTAPAPGQADEIPGAFARYIRATFPPEVLVNAPNEIAGRWKHMTGPAERKFWHSLAAVAAERDGLRELLDEIGVTAANAPEDGDSFGLLEEIAMRIGAAGVPDSTPIEEWPDPENPVTGRTPGAAAPGELAKTIRALDLARDEITALRNRCGRLLGEFGRGSDGYRARLSGTVLAREYRDAGLPVPDRLSHLESK